MNSTSPKPQLERFYALNIPDALMAIRTEHLITDSDTDNLFAAHLRINNAYSGALDKTLSGFVILEIIDDAYYLYDARDSGWVYCQRHTDRRITPCFETLEDYRAFRGADSVNPRPEHQPEGRKPISTVDLAERYQWAVWFFGRLSDEPNDASVEARWMALAANWFANGIDTIDYGEQMFAGERALLKDDVHLSVWWLLVAAALADQNWIDEVVRYGPRGNALFDAFLTALLPLGFQGNLAEFPEFKKRRARFLYDAARPGSKLFDHVDDQRVLYEQVRTLVTRSLIIDPEDVFGDKLNLIRISCEELNDTHYVIELGQYVRQGSIQALVLQALAEHAQNMNVSPAAQRVLQWIVQTPVEHPFIQELLTVFPQIVSSVADEKLVFEACKALLLKDPLHFRILEWTVRMAHALELPESALFEEQLQALQTIRPVYILMGTESTRYELEEALEQADRLNESQQALLVRKIKSAPSVFHARANHWASLR